MTRTPTAERLTISRYHDEQLP